EPIARAHRAAAKAGSSWRRTRLFREPSSPRSASVGSRARPARRACAIPRSCPCGLWWQAVRLAKHIAGAGVSSRRAAEKLIAAGRVTVDGAVERDPARDVSAQDTVAV